MSRVLVIGDVIDDIIVVPSGPIRTNTDTNASIRQTLGGSAANVASWAAHAGAEVTFIGCVAKVDEERVTKEFESFGVHPLTQTSVKEPTGSLVVLVEGETRSMLTDRGANRELDLNLITTEFLSDFSYVYLSGYALFGREEQDIQDFILRVQDAGALLVVDPGSTGYIQDFGVEKFKNSIAGVDILLPNEEEFVLITSELAYITIVTKGSLGADLYIQGIKTNSLPAPEVTSLDPTGAGDAFAGTLLAKLAGEEVLDVALTNSIAVSAEAVTTIGARPQF